MHKSFFPFKIKDGKKYNYLDYTKLYISCCTTYIMYSIDYL